MPDCESELLLYPSSYPGYILDPASSTTIPWGHIMRLKYCTHWIFHDSHFWGDDGSMIWDEAVLSLESLKSKAYMHFLICLLKNTSNGCSTISMKLIMIYLFVWTSISLYFNWLYYSDTAELCTSWLGIFISDIDLCVGFCVGVLIKYTFHFSSCLVFLKILLWCTIVQLYIIWNANNFPDFIFVPLLLKCFGLDFGSLIKLPHFKCMWLWFIMHLCLHI